MFGFGVEFIKVNKTIDLEKKINKLFISLIKAKALICGIYKNNFNYKMAEEKKIATKVETKVEEKTKVETKKSASRKVTKKVKEIYLKKEKKDVIVKFKKHDKDTWSSKVQIALLTNRINSLTEHLKIHKKDKHSRFWLIKLTGQRRKLLSYIQRKKPEEYTEIIAELWLRR